MARLPLLSLLALLAALSLVEGGIHHNKVVYDDRMLIPLTEALRFADGVRMDIFIRDITLYKGHSDKERAYNYNNYGFFLSPVEADATLEADLSDPDKCILAALPSEAVLFTFKDSGVQRVISNTTAEHKLAFTVQNGGSFYVYFANCEEDRPVSFDINIELYNLDANGRKDYSNVGETALETAYLYWVKIKSYLQGRRSLAKK